MTPISVIPSSAESTTSVPHNGIVLQIACFRELMLQVSPVRTRTSVSPSCVKVALANSAPGSMRLQEARTLSTTDELILGRLSCRCCCCSRCRFGFGLGGRAPGCCEEAQVGGMYGGICSFGESFKTAVGICALEAPTSSSPLFRCRGGGIGWSVGWIGWIGWSVCSLQKTTGFMTFLCLCLGMGFVSVFIPVFFHGKCRPFSYEKHTDSLQKQVLASLLHRNSHKPHPGLHIRSAFKVLFPSVCVQKPWPRACHPVRVCSSAKPFQSDFQLLCVCCRRPLTNVHGSARSKHAGVDQHVRTKRCKVSRQRLVISFHELVRRDCGMHDSIPSRKLALEDLKRLTDGGQRFRLVPKHHRVARSRQEIHACSIVWLIL